MQSTSVIYIMGVSGAGKTTIGKLLAARISLPFFDADDYHSAGNKAKMQAGIPLNDDDRADWLMRLHEVALQHAYTGAIIACSALKQKYRQQLSDSLPDVAWVYLHGSYELLLQRMQHRTDHFMPPALLTSQLTTIEPPEDALLIDIAHAPAEIVEAVVTYLSNKMA